MKTKSELEALSVTERESLLKQLSDDLSERVLAADDFDLEVERVIEEMERLGHNLVLFDTDGEWQIWCGDWTNPGSSTDKLNLHFDPVEGVEASWSVGEE